MCINILEKSENDPKAETSPMHRLRATAAMTAVCSICLLLNVVIAQERITPVKSRGGESQGELWAETPVTFRNGIQLPEWPVPTDLKAWQSGTRDKTRQTLIGLLGDIPQRPKSLDREDYGH